MKPYLFIEHIWVVSYQDKPIVMYGRFDSAEEFLYALSWWLRRSEVKKITYRLV